jgi:hypothetical protein
MLQQHPVAVREVGGVLQYGWTVAASAQEGARHHPLAQTAVQLKEVESSSTQHKKCSSLIMPHIERRYSVYTAPCTIGGLWPAAKLQRHMMCWGSVRLSIVRSAACGCSPAAPSMLPRSGGSLPCMGGTLVSSVDILGVGRLNCRYMTLSWCLETSTGYCAC